ncbi:MAG TPA: NADH-quinone oxidoreductase subunit H [Euryarchaeota archaeon]|nr:NADH-quinone oxidoreductase subunit H [Euryarchaeota archaeon]
MMDVTILVLSLVYVVVFPGFLFLSSFSLFTEYVDRKVHARMQKRVGPPFFQPMADFIKLMAKEDIVPSAADRTMFSAVPIVAFATVATAFLYIPTFYITSMLSFQGDLILVLFLLTVPSFALFIAGYSSSNLFGQVGGVRAMTQLFSYEIPFLLALLAPAVAVGSWGMADIVAWSPEIFGTQIDFFWPVIVAPIAFVIAIITLQGKIMRIPFDMPEAETEIVDGPLAEYSGRRLAIWRMTMDMELVVGAALISAVFLGGPSLPMLDLSALPDVGGYHVVGWAVGFLIFISKTTVIILISTFLRSSMARIKIDQLVNLCYRYLAPLAVFQLMLIAIIKYVGWL